ncbi:MAG TPA: hypothetical protein DDW52_18525 [Planctomycetaceae bacterium]|nr:hypothetical protein [Planctomycetaceae bacterium]
MLLRILSKWDELLRAQPPSQRSCPADATHLNAFALEERILYSASPVSDELLTGEAHTPVDFSDVHLGDWTQSKNTVANANRDSLQSLSHSDRDSVGPGQQPDAGGLPWADDSSLQATHSQELVFIDSSVEGLQTLLDDIASLSDPGRQIEIVFLDPNRDGVLQISDALHGRTSIDAMHVVSHGTDGEVWLGNGLLSIESLDRYRTHLAEWSNALGVDADVLFYGCDLASSESGRALINEIGTICSCDIAASEDITGHSDLGGDWTLEYTFGEVETDVAVGYSAQASWYETLDINTGLVGHYEYDSTGFASDSAGNQDAVVSTGNATFETPAAVGDQALGFAIDASGNNSYLEVTDNAAQDFGDDNFTVGLWYKLDGTPLSNGRLLGDYGGTGNGFLIYAQPGGTIEVQLHDGTVVSDSIQGNFDGTWNQLTVVRSDSTLNIYHNGANVSSIGGADGNINSSNPLWIGASGALGGDFDGQLDDVRLFNRALSATDVAELVAVGPTSVPGPQFVNENTTLTFSVANGNRITVSDSLSGTNAQMHVSLSTTDGVLTLSQTSGLTFLRSSNGSSSFVLSGSEADINAALEGMTFTPDADFEGSVTLNVTPSLDAELLAHYQFEGNANDTSSGATQHGTFHGGAATTIDAQRGEVLSLDGNGDYVQIAGLFSNPGNVTLAGWINCTGVDTSGASILSLGTSPALYLNAGGQLEGFFESGGTGNTVTGNENLVGTGWRHVALTIDDTTREMSIYLDGELVSSITASGPIEYDNSPDTYIGRKGDGGSGGDFAGFIDETRLYSRALTAEEIAALSSGNVAITVQKPNTAPYFISTPNAISDTVQNLSGAISVSSGDFDNDGDIDLVSTSNTGQLLWHENDGNGVFSAGVLIATANDFTSVATHDLDGDGDIDIVAMNDDPAQLADSVYVLTNGFVGSGNVSFSTDTFEGAAVGESDGAEDLAMGDIDGDGRPDIAALFRQSGSNSQLVVFEQNAPGTWTKTLSDPISNGHGLQIVDLDNDSHLDLVVGEFHTKKMYFYENLGGAIAYFLKHEIYEETTSNIYDLVTGDFDSDGDEDIAFITWGINGGMAVLESDGASDPSFTQTQFIVFSGSLTYHIDTADINGDGHLDLVVSDRGLDSLIVYENDGEASFTPNIISSDSGGPVWAEAADINGDGHDDLIFAAYDAGFVGLHINQGNGNFIRGVVNEDVALGGIGVQIMDDDAGDGLLEVTINVANGRVTLDTASVSVVTGANNSPTVTFAGTIASLNSALATLVYTPDPNFSGLDEVAITVDDRGNSGSGGILTETEILYIEVAAANDTPVVLGPGAAYHVFEHANLNVHGSGFSVADVDAFSGTMTATLTVGEGILVMLAGDSGVNITANSASTVSFTGTLAQINSLLTGTSTGVIAFNNAGHMPSPSTTITLTVNDQGNSGLDPGTTGDASSEQASASQTINIIATNDHPGNSGFMPSDVFATEDTLTAIVLSAVNFIDLDAGASDLTVTLTTSTGGQLTLGADASIDFGGTSTSRTLTGTLAELNAYFNDSSNIQYLHATPHTFGNDADTLTVTINDNGNTGTGGGHHQPLGLVNIDISGVNDEQVLVTNTGATVGEGSFGNSITTAMLHATDIDNADAQLVYTVDAIPFNGTLRLGGSALSGGQTFTQADVDAGNVTYDHDGSESSTDSFEFTVDDGVGSAETATFSFTITNVNDAPVNTVPGAQLSDEDTPLSISGISVDDSDGNLSTVRLTVNNGVLNVSVFGTTSISAGANGSSDLTLSGSAADIKASLATLTYLSDLNFSGSDTLTVLSTDTDTATSSETVPITVSAVNDTPVVYAPSAAYSVVEQVNLNIHGTGFSVSDVDASSSSLTATLTVGEGMLAVFEGNSGVTITANSAATVSFTGTVAEINSLLKGTSSGSILYNSISSAPSPSTSITLTLNDEGNTGADPGTTADATSEQSSASQTINITAVNDAPGNAGSLPSTVTVVEDVLTAIDLSAITFSDVDAGSSDLTVTLSTSTGGHFALATDLAIDFGGTPSERTLTGTLAELNAYFDNSSNIHYLHSVPHAFGTGIDTITVVINDNGNTGIGGGHDRLIGSVSVDISGVNDIPYGIPTIFGTATEDEVLTASTGGIADYDGLGTFSFQWERDWTPIIGATSSAYTLGDDDVGSRISVTVSYTDPGGTMEGPIRSALTSPVANINDVSAIQNLTGDTLIYNEGQTIAAIDQGAAAIVTDIDSPDFDSGSLTVSIISGGYPTDDTLQIIEQGTGTGEVSTAGGNVFYEGTLIGTFAGGSGGTDLSISLGANADATATTSLVRAIGYRDTGTGGITGGTRTVRFTLDDGDGGTSASYDTAVTVVTSNDPVENTGTFPATLNVTEDIASDLDLSGIHLRDPESPTGAAIVSVLLETTNGGLIQVADDVAISIAGAESPAVLLTGNVNAINSYLNETSNLRYLHPTENLNGNAADSLRVTVGDGFNNTLLGNIAIDIASVNDLPISRDYVVGEDPGETLLIVADVGLLSDSSDVDGDELTAVLYTGPESGTLIVNADGSWSYAPAAGQIDDVQFEFRIFDGTDYSETYTVLIDMATVGGTVTDDPAGTDVNSGEGQETEPADPTNDPAEEIDEASSFENGTTTTTKESGSTEPASEDDGEGTAARSAAGRGDGAAEQTTGSIEATKFRRAAHTHSSDWSHSIELTVSQFSSSRFRRTSFIDELYYAEEISNANFDRQLSLQRIAMQEFNELTENSDFICKVKSNTAAGIVAGATAGVAVWTISGTYLASLAFSSMPAWIRIDPIFVVGHTTSNDEDDTSIADLIAGQQDGDSEHPG